MTNLQQAILIGGILAALWLIVAVGLGAGLGFFTGAAIVLLVTSRRRQRR